MTVVIYGDLLSQPTRAVVQFCCESQVPYTLILVRIDRQQHKTDVFLRLSLKQQVPVIDDEGFVLNESSAILRYLSITRHSHLYPEDLKERARVDSWLDWRDANLRAGASRVVFFEGGLAERIGRTVAEQAQRVLLHDAHSMLRRSLKIMEQHLAQGPRLFFVNDTISIVDLSLIEELTMLRLVPSYNGLMQFPHVEQWMERVPSHCKHWDIVHHMLDKAVQERLQQSGEEVQWVEKKLSSKL